MDRDRRTASLATLVFVVAQLVGQSGTAAVKPTKSPTETRAFPAAGIRIVHVSTVSGDVHVSSNSGGAEATLVATKREFGDACSFVAEVRDKTLFVEVKQTGFFKFIHDCRVDIALSVPRGVNVNAALGSGDLEVQGIRGELAYKVGSGDVRANGAFTSVDGKSGSGGVNLAGLLGGGSIVTGSGNMRLAYAKTPKTGLLDIKAGSGEAVVLMPKGSKVHANLRAGSGSLINEIGDDPKSTFELDMKAGMGDLRIQSL